MDFLTVRHDLKTYPVGERLPAGIGYELEPFLCKYIVNFTISNFYRFWLPLPYNP